MKQAIKRDRTKALGASKAAQSTLVSCMKHFTDSLNAISAWDA